MIGADVVATFSPENARRIEWCIDLLVPHLAAEEYVFVGGLAIRYHVTIAGLEYPKRPFNDLDIAVKDRNSLSPNVCSNFLVAHYHPPDYWALVEPTSRIKVDLFGWAQIPGIIDVPYKKGSLRVQSAESQLAKTVKDTRKVLKGEAVDPKQFEDAKLLLRIADQSAAYKFFTGLEATPPPSMQAALRKAQQAAQEHPELLASKPHRKPAAHICTECVNTTDYQLTPLGEIYKILNWG